jgi:hypothetical protein
MKDLVLEASTESKSIKCFKHSLDLSMMFHFDVNFRQVLIIIFLSRHIFAESFSVRFAPD